MRTASTVVCIALVTGAASLCVREAHAQCSVFDRQPCVPSFCSVFGYWPCIPEFEAPIGQDLRLTIESRRETTGAAPKQEGAEHAELNTIRDLFAALRACWVPPPREEAWPGMQYSVRLSFKRTGEIIAKPRVTYVSRDAPVEARNVYAEAVNEALDRCTPLPLTKGFGGALAGRPIAIRFVDNRE